MSFTRVSSLDRSIDKVNVWLADIADEFGINNRNFAYHVIRAWLHALRDRLPVPIAAHFAAQLPELLRGVFYDGWNPSKVPVKYGRSGYITRFTRDSGVSEPDVPRVAALVTRVVRRHVSGGVLDEALDVLPAEARLLVEPRDFELLTRGER